MKRLIYERLYESKTDLFYTLFFDELDSWFSTEFFLCDYCFNEFKENWKGLVLMDSSLRLSLMPLECFYSGTLLSHFFNIEEFNEYLHLIKCPYCSRPLEYNFLPYSFSDEIEDYQPDIEMISKLANRTPFLLLSNPFAIETLELIKKFAKTSSNETIDEKFYRGRINKKPNIMFNYSEIGAVPDSLAKEGRFNHSGHGHLYVSTTEEICLKEIGAYQKKSASIAKIKLLKPLKILDLTDIDQGQKDNDLFKAIVFSSLIYNSPSDDSWEKPEYVFTRFITDCALFIGFDGIKYKSRYNFEGANFVIFKDKSTENFTWDSIYSIEDVQLIN